MFLWKQQTRWGFILKYLVYLLDSKSNAFREFLLSPELYFVGQNQTLILKEKNLPTKAWLSAVGTQGSNNSIKIRRTSNWNTLVPKQLSSFHPSCVWFRKGIKICSISKWSREVFFFLFCFVSIQINCSSTTEAGVYETLTAVPDDYYRRPYFYGISCKKRFNSCCLTFSGLSPVSYVTYTYLILAKLLWLWVLCVCFHCQVSVAITLNHSYYIFKSFLFFIFFSPVNIHSAF